LKKLWQEKMSSSFPSPENRYFEDYVAGAVYEFGSIGVAEQEVLDFGKRFVPLSYHGTRSWRRGVSTGV
jgi:hypothetical protein